MVHPLGVGLDACDGPQHALALRPVVHVDSQMFFLFHFQGHATILHQAAGFLFGRVHEGVRQSFRTGVNCRRKLLASTVASAGIIISDVISLLLVT